MNIGLIDVDGHNFPNLALMKISAYHKANNDNVYFYDPLFTKPDKIYASKVFTYTQDYGYYPGDIEIIKGGTGYNIYDKLSEEIEYILPDYKLYNCNYAYGFLTRGCPNNCQWCIVPKKEGKMSAHMDIDDIIADKKSAVLMDNNVLASNHGLRQIEKMGKMNIKVDFNQGLDARLIDDSVAKLLSKIKWLSPLRMACDTLSQMPHIKKATELLRKHGCTPKNYFIYVLVKDIADAHERVLFLKNLNLDPFAQPYRDFINNSEPDKILKQFSRWVNHKAVFKTVEWDKYKKGA